MKLQKTRQFVQTEGILQSNNFEIRFSPKIVKILSDGIYSNKILAVLRELSTNAVDSLVEAKSNKGYEVKLPSSLDNNLTIRDRGTGLAPERVHEIYRIYGASNRDGSDDYIGQMGIGSKVFFCYGNRCAVIDSFYNGKQTTYSAYLDETGLPKLDLLNENDTKEDNGVKITIPCCASDIYNFKSEAEKLYAFFSHKPKFIGQNQPNIPKIENILESPNGWAIRKENYSHHNGLVGIMGQLAYPISFEDDNLSNEIQELFNCPITLYFDIGELEIAASREALSYNTRSKSAIIAKCKVVLDEIKGKIEDEIKDAKTLYQARRKIGEVRKKLPSYKLQNLIPVSDLEWQGHKLFPKDWMNYGLTCYLPPDFNGVAYSCSYIDIPWANPRIRQSRHLSWENNFEFIEADCKVGNQSRAKEYVTTKGKGFEVFLVGFPTDKEKKAFLKLMGMEEAELVKASSLPKPAAQVRVSSGGTKVATTRVMEFIDGRNAMSSWWKGTNVDINATDGYYVEFNQYAAYDALRKIKPDELDCHIKNLNILLKKDQKSEISTIYGIKTAIIPKLAKSPQKWQNVFDVIRNTMDGYAKNEKFVLAKEIYGNFQVGGSFTIKKSTYLYEYLYKLDLDKLISLKKLVKNDDLDDWVSELEDQSETINKYTDTIQAYIKLEDFYKPTLKTVKFERAADIEDRIYKKWPLLCNLRNDFSDMKLLVPYVQAL